MRNRLVLCTLGIACLLAPLLALAQPLRIVAAENFYGDVAQQIGGPLVQVRSILLNPEQDPHLFEANVSTVKALTDAQLLIYNGAAYDAWMDKLLRVAHSAPQTVLVVGALTQAKAGDNPHLWYAPATMPTLARALADSLAQRDPAHSATYRSNLQTFLDSLQGLNATIARIKSRSQGQSVTATEPVFGYMAEALGLQVRNAAFQLAVMNDTEPAARDVARMEDDLRRHAVRALLYNSQASNRAAQKMRTLALQQHVPVVGVSETLPAGQHYQDWMQGQLERLDAALATAPP